MGGKGDVSLVGEGGWEMIVEAITSWEAWKGGEGGFWNLSHFGAIPLLEMGVGVYSLGKRTGFFLNCFPFARSPRRCGVWIPRECKWNKAWFRRGILDTLMFKSCFFKILSVNCFLFRFVFFLFRENDFVKFDSNCFFFRRICLRFERISWILEMF